jgi:ArsR family transcriptional regulator, virulence genes transcriptional regulator
MTRTVRRSPSALDREGFELEADMLRVLANPKRLMIVGVLGEGARTVSEIAQRLDLSLQNTSQHLRLMRDRHIVRSRRDGREVRYALTSPVFPRCCELVRHALVEQTKAREADLSHGWTLPAEPAVPIGLDRPRARSAAAPS